MIKSRSAEERRNETVAVKIEVKRVGTRKRRTKLEVKVVENLISTSTREKEESKRKEIQGNRLRITVIKCMPTIKIVTGKKSSNTKKKRKRRKQRKITKWNRVGTIIIKYVYYTNNKDNDKKSK